MMKINRRKSHQTTNQHVDGAVSCGAVEESLSALFDGEFGLIERAAVDAHLSVCSHCKSFASSLREITNAFRMESLEKIPDLTHSILTKLETSDRERSGVFGVATPLQLERRQVRRRYAFAAALIPLCLAMTGWASGGFIHPTISPSHQKTPCTAKLRQTTSHVHQKNLSPALS